MADQQGDRRQAEVPAHLPGGRDVRARASATSRSTWATPASSGCENDFLAGTSDALLANRIKDMFTGDETGGGNVLLTHLEAGAGDRVRAS